MLEGAQPSWDCAPFFYLFSAIKSGCEMISQGI